MSARRAAARAAAHAAMFVIAAVAAAGAQAQLPSWSLEAQRRLFGGGAPALDIAERQRLVGEGEARLAAGDVVAAQAAFDAAAAIVHSADVEAGLVRTYMQAGDYRRALAFAAHAAGAHRNVPGGQALYAWLLHAGGQGLVARRVLDDALAAAPDDAALRAAQRSLAGPRPQPGPALMTPPLRLAPYAHGAAVPPEARHAGTATRLGGAAAGLAVAPAAVADAGTLWLRTAFGQAVRATPLRRIADNHLVLLALDDMPEGTPPSADPAAPAREPFAGSPAYAVGYAGAADGQPNWPLLEQGFFGRGTGGPAPRPLVVDGAADGGGAPVFDAQGRLAGVTLPTADGRRGWLPIAGIVDAAGTGPAPDRQATPGPRMDIDRLYEQALRLTLEVLARP